MTHRTIIGCCIVLLTFGGTAHAERWMIPAGAHVTGAQNTNWRSDLQLVNPTDSEVSVTVYLLEAGRDNSVLDRSTTYSVPAQGQLVAADVFLEDFGVEGTGALLVECAEPRLVATTRTYNLVSDGSTYGQFIPAVALANAQAAGEEGQIIYLAKSPDFRSNLGFAVTTDTGGRVTVELYDADGVLLGSTERDFIGFEQHQFNNIFGATGSPPSAVARAVVRATAPIVAYGSVVDQRTGDPVAIMARRLSEAATELAIPAAARAAGAQGSLWRTDIRVFNPGEMAARVTFEYHRKGVPNKARPTTTLTVGAGRILALDDFMSTGFDLEEANGGIEVSADQPVLLWSRTYNQADTGTFGQSIPAVGADGLSGTDWERVYTGLSNVDFRSNVGFFNLDDDAVTLELAMRDGGGNPAGEASLELEPGVMDQINDVFAFLGVPGGESFWLSIKGSGSVASYTSVSDNISSDPVYQAGVPKAPACTLGSTSAADAYIRGGDHADTGFGTTPNLLIKGTTSGSYARKIYLVFDVSSDAVPESFSSVMLQITVIRHVATVPRGGVLFGVIDNDDWNPDILAETDITWNNAPRNDPASGVGFLDQGATSQNGVRQLAMITFDNEDPPGTSYEFDITDFVRWARGDNPGFSAAASGGDSDGLVTLLLAHSEELWAVDGSEFYSRENTANEGCNQPQLIFGE